MKKQKKNKLIKIQHALEKFLDEINDIIAEENDIFDSHSEAWQDSPRGDAAYSIIDALDAASADVESAVQNIEEAINTEE